MSTEMAVAEAVREIRRYHRIGTRTRTYRAIWGHQEHVIDHLIDSIQYGVTMPGYHDDTMTAACRRLYMPVVGWLKHVGGYRLPGHQIANLRRLTPYQWVALLGEMADAKVTCTGDAERFFETHPTRTAAA